MQSNAFLQHNLVLIELYKMVEPQRIGLSKQANGYLDEMLDFLKSQPGGQELIKFDLYRLAVALGVKKGINPAPLSDKSDSTLRVTELDPDKALFYAVEAANLQDAEEAIYQTIERLAEQGIRQFYDDYIANMGRLPWDKLLL